MSEREAWNKSWNVNVAGTQIVTSTFMPLLLKSSDPRLIFITSGASSLEAASQSVGSSHWKAPPAGWPKEGAK